MDQAPTPVVPQNKKPRTETTVKRLVYFRGHKKQKNSALITKVCLNYETVPQSFEFECASRTLANLYNLQTVRGPILEDGQLDLASAMSGPHEYYGYIDPLEYHVLDIFARGPTFFKCDPPKTALLKKRDLPEKFIYQVKDSNWIRGRDVTDTEMKKYNLVYQAEEESYMAEGSCLESSIKILPKAPPPSKQKPSSNQKSDDSLFDYPGVLELEESELVLTLVTDPQNYDLSTFNASVVPNGEPWSFNRDLVKKYEHAQHKLRVVTYNYGEDYVEKYLMKGNGIFIEDHEFIQSISPLDKTCGGFVILGRRVKPEKSENTILELIAIALPYGFTLLVDAMSIHGDSALTGTYVMSMTGNHIAMGTANTVFLKTKKTSKNTPVYAKTECARTVYPKTDLALTSNQLSLVELHTVDAGLKRQIKQTVSELSEWAAINAMRGAVFQPVIYTPNGISGWEKTLGTELPTPK